MPPLVPTLDLTAADLNLAIIGGDGMAVTFTFSSNVDMTGYTVESQVVGRKSRDLVQVIDAQIVQANPAVITVALLGVETLPLAGLALDWWLEVTPLGGQPRTLLQGRFTVEEQ